MYIFDILSLLLCILPIIVIIIKMRVVAYLLGNNDTILLHINVFLTLYSYNIVAHLLD